MSGALILTGAPGSGKTSVLEALSTQLEIDDVGFGAIEVEHLATGWPWLTLEESLVQLAAVLALQRDAGRDTFLVVATTEDEDELSAVIDAVGADDVLVVCLTAPAEVVADRVAAREPDDWPGKAALVDHSRGLAVEIPSIAGIDARIDTVGREAREVAAEIKELLAVSGII